MVEAKHLLMHVAIALYELVYCAKYSIISNQFGFPKSTPNMCVYSAKDCSVLYISRFLYCHIINYTGYNQK